MALRHPFLRLQLISPNRKRFANVINIMKLSVIIPTKNEQVLLPRLLECLEKQSFRDFEVVVADANSTDRTREIATSFGAKVVDGGMPGPGRNRGSEAASGEIFLFMDADVLLPSEHYLGDTLQEFEMLKADVATCKLKPMSDKYFDHFFHHFYNGYTRLTEGVRPHAPGSCIFSRRDAHLSIGGFDEEVVFAEDMEYVQRAHRKGYRFRMLLSHAVLVSVRRLEKDGRINIAAKYVYGELHMMTKGPFRRMPYEYEMGGDVPKNP